MTSGKSAAFGLSAFLFCATALAGAGPEPAIIQVVKTGKVDAVRAALRTPENVNAAEADGTTALHWAVLADEFETTQLLLHAGARVNAANRYGVTPLALAATNGNATIIATLIKAGADPNTEITEGETVLMRAARNGRPEAVRTLLEAGARANVVEGSLGETAVMWAAAENNAEAVELLAQAGANLDVASSVERRPRRYNTPSGGGSRAPLPTGGWTALMYAARQGSVDAARVLVDSHANLNLAEPEGMTALVIAIINGHYDLAALLIEKGADPNLADSSGMTPLYAAVDMHTRPHSDKGDAGPRSTAGREDNLRIASLLLDHRADPNPRLRRIILSRNFVTGDINLAAGSTPFMRAAKSADVTMMRRLLEKGADPLLTQKNHTTALMLAAGLGASAREANPQLEEKSIEAMTICLDRGIDVNAFNDSGETAMHVAASRGDRAIAFLAERGAILDIKDRRGRTPLDRAQATKSAPLLRQLTANANAPAASAKP